MKIFSKICFLGVLAAQLAAPMAIGAAKELSKREACALYENTFIGYYGDVFFVSQCKRLAVSAEDLMRKGQQRYPQIKPVDGAVIRAIPESHVPYAQFTKRSCKDLEHHYVTQSNLDVFYVEKCHRHLLSDWYTFLEHRRKRHPGSEVLELTIDEFASLPEAAPITSVLDASYSQLYSEGEGIEIIPVDEACRGLNGRLASFYSLLYRIENCRKRAIDAEMYSKETRGNMTTVELTPQQWYSLPDGPDVKLATQRQPKEQPGSADN